MTRRVEGWHVLIGAGFLLSALLLIAGAAGVVWVIAHGVDSTLTAYGRR